MDTGVKMRSFVVIYEPNDKLTVCCVGFNLLANPIMFFTLSSERDKLTQTKTLIRFCMRKLLQKSLKHSNKKYCLVTMIHFAPIKKLKKSLLLTAQKQVPKKGGLWFL